MIVEGRPVVLFLAVCTECGATGTMNQIGGTTGQHGPLCPYHPQCVGQET